MANNDYSFYNHEDLEEIKALLRQLIAVDKQILEAQKIKEFTNQRNLQRDL